LAGAGATRFLAAFGAEVIRVEDPTRQGRWDVLRGSGPFVDERRGLELGGAFNNYNVEKKGITINLKDPRGRALFADLVRVSDVVTENFATGVMDRIGLGYDDLRALRDDIIYVSNCGFGHTGPYAPYKTWGPVVQAICGLTFMSGLPGMPPAGFGYSYMDHHGANFMAVAVLAAVIHRKRTGEGQWIDMACTEAGATLLGPEVLDAAVNQRSLRRSGMPDSNHNRSPTMVPHNIYATAGTDNWIAIACRHDADWEALAQLIREPWAQAPELHTLQGRLSCEQQIDAGMGAWCIQQNRFALAARLQDAGIPATAVQQPSERIDADPNTKAWGLWPVVKHPEMGDIRVDGLPVHLSETDWSLEHGAPRLGEHNEDVFVGLLGRDSAELDQLRAAGVI
jgi:crotonobetainyl-CoA:carnitine CoA-transferase CaiB-like acyl-CoA transferase